jgi:hypothetical protein
VISGARQDAARTQSARDGRDRQTFQPCMPGWIDLNEAPGMFRAFPDPGSSHDQPDSRKKDRHTQEPGWIKGPNRRTQKPKMIDHCACQKL